MTDSNENNVAPLPGTFMHMVSEAQKKKPEKAVIIFTHREEGAETVSVQFTGGIDYRDLATLLLSFQLFIHREYM
jgi:hypothetical protein